MLPSTPQLLVYRRRLITGGGGITTVFSHSVTGNDSGNNGWSFRQKCLTTGASGGSGQVRCTFHSSGAAWVVAHASIGKAVNATGVNPNTTATPVELLFSGGSGFNIGTSNTDLTSDWANFTWSNGDTLIVVMDITSGNEGLDTGSGELWLNGATSSYNTADVTGLGFTSQAWTAGVNKIETQ